MHPIVGRAYVSLGSFRRYCLDMRHHQRKIFVVACEPWRRRAMEQFRCNGEVSLSCEAIRHVAYVRIDAERLLEHDEPRMRANASGPHDVRAHRRTAIY